MIFLLFSTLLFSVGNVLWKKNLEKVGYFYLTAYRAFFTSLISFAILIFFGMDWQMIIETPFLRVSLGSIFGAIGLFSMLYVMKSATLQWISIYNLVGIFFTGIYLFFYESVDFTYSLFGICLILIGFTLYVFSHQKLNQNLSIIQHLFLLLMIVGFGVSSILHWKNLGSLVQPLYILWNQELIVFIISIAILSFSKSSVSSSIPIIRFYFPTILLMSLVILFALYFGLLGLQDTNPLISSAFALGTPLFTIFFGALYFKEKLSVTSAIAITLISIGVFWINYYGF